MRHFLWFYFRLHRLWRRLGRQLGPFVALLERRLLGRAPVVEIALPEPRRDYRVLLPVANPHHAGRLARFAAAIAGTRDGEVIVLYVDRQAPQAADRVSAAEGLKLAPDPTRWRAVKIALDAVHRAGVPAGYVVRQATNVGRAIRREARRQNADVIVMGWRGRSPVQGQGAAGEKGVAQKVPEGEGESSEQRLDATLDAVLEDPPADVMVIGGHGDEVPERVLVPFVTIHDAPTALRLARALTRDRGVVAALRVVDDQATIGQVEDASHQFAQLLRRYGEEEVARLVVRAPDRATGILRAIERGYDGVVMAAPAETILDRLLFGATQMCVAEESGVPVIVVKGRSGPLTYLARRLWRRAFEALPKLDEDERAAVYAEIESAAAPRADFFVMIGLSAAIASFGLMMDSPAVIIGAMLVAPLMAAIVGVGLGVVEGHLGLVRRAASAALRGAALAVGVSVAIAFVGVAVGVLQLRGQVGVEILARTRPTLLDLGVALASGAAGAYALSRKGVQASLAGVAIAAALVPPLATVGIGVAVGLPQVALGALVLYLTNFIAIAAAGGITFLLLGFGPTAEEEAERRVLVLGFRTATVALALVAIILGIVTWRLYPQARRAQEIAAAVQQELAHYPDTRLVSVSTDEKGDLLRLDVTIQLPSSAVAGFDYRVARQIQHGVATQLGRSADSVQLELTVIPTVRLGPPSTPTADRAGR